MPSSNEMRARAKAQMPTVLLTLLSILQALALELIWTHVREHDYLLAPSWVALISWVQIVATLLGVLLIWVAYANNVMRFRWVPTTGDSLYPFLIGILELVLIATLGPEWLGYWFVILGVLFATTAAALQMVFRRARLDGENDEWFATIPPATLRDFYPVMGVVGLLVGLGILLGLSGHRGVFALAALIVATAALVHQLFMNHWFWKRSMELGD